MKKILASKVTWYILLLIMIVTLLTGALTNIFYFLIVCMVSALAMIAIDIYNTPDPIDQKEARREIYQFFHFDEENPRAFGSISDVLTYERDGTRYVRITSNYPGIVIGAKGELINRLEEHLNKYLDYEVKVEIVELGIWKNLFR